MSVTTAKVTIGTTAVQIDGNDVNPVTIYIHNLDSTKELFIGGANVTTSNGYVINKSSEQSFTLSPGDALYMISSGAGHEVSYMKMTKF